MAVVQDWIEDYLTYTAPQESPEIFHRWAGIAIIGAVLNRRVGLPRISRTGVLFYQNFPGQVSPIFVAGSGKAKKSTAIKLAKDLLRDTGGVNIFDGKITPERLLHKLESMPGKQAVLCTVASELSAFLGNQSYNNGLIDILTKLADCEAHPYETQKGGAINLTDHNICFTLIGGTTPKTLADAIPPEAQQHGFLSRYIWVYSEKSGKIEPLANDEDRLDPRILAESIRQREALIIRLRAMRTLNGNFRWGDARGWWIKHYEDYMKTIQSDGEGWPTRRWDHISRVAMILNVSRGCSTLILDESDLTLAEKLIVDVETNRDRCFSFIGRHANSEQQTKILAALRGQGLVKDEALFNKVQMYFGSMNELRGQLNLLKSSGAVGDVQAGKLTFWKFLKEPY